MRRRNPLWCLALALLLAGAACGEQGSLELDAPPPLPDTRAVDEAPAVVLAVDPAEQRLAQLERQLHEARVWTAAEGRSASEQRRRWAELAQAARGTEVAALARSRIEALERSAVAPCRAAREAIGRAYFDGARDRLEQQITAIRARYAGFEAIAPVDASLAQIEAHEAALGRAALRVRVGFAAGLTPQAAQRAWSPERARLVRAQNVVPRGKDNFGNLVLHAPGNSLLDFALTVDAKPKRVFLLVQHFSSFAGGQFSPITVIVNRQVVAGAYNPVGCDWGFWTAWDVTRQVRQGQNQLIILLEPTAQTNYWIYGLELTDVDPAPLLAPR